MIRFAMFFIFIELSSTMPRCRKGDCLKKDGIDKAIRLSLQSIQSNTTMDDRTPAVDRGPTTEMMTSLLHRPNSGSTGANEIRIQQGIKEILHRLDELLQKSKRRKSATSEENTGMSSRRKHPCGSRGIRHRRRLGSIAYDNLRHWCYLRHKNKLKTEGSKEESARKKRYKFSDYYEWDYHVGDYEYGSYENVNQLMETSFIENWNRYFRHLTLILLIILNIVVSVCCVCGHLCMIACRRGMKNVKKYTIDLWISTVRGRNPAYLDFCDIMSELDMPKPTYDQFIQIFEAHKVQ